MVATEEGLDKLKGLIQSRFVWQWRLLPN